MLYLVIQDFLSYFRLADFSQRSLQALSIQLNEFTELLNYRIYQVNSKGHVV